MPAGQTGLTTPAAGVVTTPWDPRTDQCPEGPRSSALVEDMRRSDDQVEDLSAPGLSGEHFKLHDFRTQASLVFSISAVMAHERIEVTLNRTRV